jgi:hypothetical protein
VAVWERESEQSFIERKGFGEVGSGDDTEFSLCACAATPSLGEYVLEKKMRGSLRRVGGAGEPSSLVPVFSANSEDQRRSEVDTVDAMVCGNGLLFCQARDEIDNSPR